jgi:hypothetical protein
VAQLGGEILRRDHARLHTGRGLFFRRRTGRANDGFIASRNANPRPFVWHAKGEDILAKLNRARKALGIPELDTAVPPTPEKKKRKRGRKGKRIYESAH